MYLEC
jgi:hypothetical protein